MRPALPPLWPVSALVIALAGCQSTAPTPAADLPGGLIPYSHQMRPPEDASRLVTTPPPRRRRNVAVRPEPLILPPVVDTTQEEPRAVIEWHAELRPVQSLAQLERPVGAPFAPRRIAGNAGVSYAHAADYSWLLGCLVHDFERDRWCVRYAHPGEPDSHDGLLELVSTGPMVGFHPGQLVRVEGELVDPQPLEINPAYRVHVIQAVRR